jgi:aryl-alcohol dehydrogenase-like predicted oxidoreductase
MQYRYLGQSGLKVSEICLGSMTFGRGADQAGTTALVDAALEAGVNFFDTADGYNAGAAETMLGQALQGRRRDVVLASKVFNAMGPGPNDSGASRAHIMLAAEDSLRRLQTDWLDIYYIHHVDVQTPLEEQLRAVDDLVRQGKVRYIACSNFEAWRLMEALWTSDSRGWSRFAAYQPQYSLVVRDIEQEIVPVCELKGLGVAVWSPLAGGYLTGKYKSVEAPPAGSRAADGWAIPARFFHAHHPAILAELIAVAAELGRPPAQVALRWVLERPWVTSAIVGARTAAQLADTLQATGFTLPRTALERLDRVSLLAFRYPRSMEDTMVARRNEAMGKLGQKG